MLNKLNILQIPYGGLGSGGVSSVILSIVETLHPHFNFTCLVFDKMGAREQIFRRYSSLKRVKFCYAPGTWYRWFTIILRPFILYAQVYKMCKQEHFDVVHCHNGYDQWIGLMAAKHAGVNIRIAHSHNTNTPARIGVFKRWYRLWAVRLVNCYATVRLGCSGQACHDFFGDVSWQVIYNTVDLKKFDGTKRLSFQAKRFIHVGRYAYEKNQEFVLEVFAELHKQFQDITLDLVGTGSRKSLLEEQIKQYHLQQSVRLIDGTEVDIPAQYAKADYMIFPSRCEAFGIVLIEAQAMGVHCFVSQVVQPDINCGLVTFLKLEDGPKKWAASIAPYVHNGSVDNKPDEKRLHRFDPQRIAMQYKKIYEGNI